MEVALMDAVFLMLTAGLVAMTIGLIWLCNSLMGGQS
jgi:hypothetical protein